MRCAIGMGSNQGDRLENLRRARTLILASEQWLEADPAPVSAPIYETEPVDCPPGSAPFLNTVLEVGVHPYASPVVVWQRLQDIEHALGRPTRHERNAPRLIDLDLLCFGRLELTTAGLTLPHPRMRGRRFVLAPLAEIQPGLVLPGERRSISELLAALPEAPDAVRLASDW